MSRTRVLVAGVTLGILACWSAPPVAHAQTLNIASNDNPLIIRGKLDPDTHTFRGAVRITAVGGDVEPLRLLRPDLLLDGDPTVKIDRSEVSIPDGINLKAGEPQDVVVTVSEVAQPGTYRGTLEFVPAGRAAGAAQLPIELVIGEVARLRPLHGAQTFTVVKCGSLLSCAVARLLVPAGQLAAGQSVTLENQVRVDLEVDRTVIDAQGTKTGQALGPDALDFDLPHTLPADATSPVGLTIRTEGVSSDVYQGSVQLKIADSRASAPVTLTLNVRDGPMYAILFVVLGIIVGRMAKKMQSPEAQLQVKLYPRLRRLRDRAARIEDPVARAQVIARLDAFEARLDRAEETEQVLTAELDAVDALIGLLIDLDELTDKVAAPEVPAALQGKLQTAISMARTAALEGKTEDARAAIKTVEAELHKATSDLAMGERADFLAAIGAAFSRGDANLERMTTAVSEMTRGPRFPGLAAFLGFLSGEPARSAKVRYWLFRPLLFVTLLVLLVLIGLQTLYVNNLSFGAAGMYDYLGLFLWGLGADVTQATLQSLPTAGNG